MPPTVPGSSRTLSPPQPILLVNVVGLVRPVHMAIEATGLASDLAFLSDESTEQLEQLPPCKAPPMLAVSPWSGARMPACGRCNTLKMRAFLRLACAFKPFLGYFANDRWLSQYHAVTLPGPGR